MNFILKHPLITEKATLLAEQGQYLFLVERQATKPEIKKAVEKTYKVIVTQVQVVNTRPKKRHLGPSSGIKPGYKKAYVSLKKGQKLDSIPQ